MFQKVDCVRLRVQDLEEGLRFYHERLGHELVRRRGSAAIVDREACALT